MTRDRRPTRLFRRYFGSMRFWFVDTVLCYLVAMIVTPADPLSTLIVFVPLLVAWLLVRLFIARQLAKVAD